MRKEFFQQSLRLLKREDELWEKSPFLGCKRNKEMCIWSIKHVSGIYYCKPRTRQTPFKYQKWLLVAFDTDIRNLVYEKTLSTCVPSNINPRVTFHRRRAVATKILETWKNVHEGESKKDFFNNGRREALLSWKPIRIAQHIATEDIHGKTDTSTICTHVHEHVHHPKNRRPF